MIDVTRATVALSCTWSKGSRGWISSASTIGWCVPVRVVGPAFIYLARWPSRQASQHARDRITFLTMRARLAAPVEQVVRDIHVLLRSWAGFCRYGNSAHAFDKIRKYAEMRLAIVPREEA